MKTSVRSGRLNFLIASGTVLYCTVQYRTGTNSDSLSLLSPIVPVPIP